MIRCTLLRSTRSCRVAAGVGDDQLDLAAGDRVVALLEEEQDPLLHLLAAGGERAAAHGEEADPDRLALGEGRRGDGERRGRGEGGQAGEPHEHRECLLRDGRRRSAAPSAR
jgi:hypothetical protein